MPTFKPWGYIIAAISILAILSSIVWGAKALYTDVLETGKALQRAETTEAERKWKDAYLQRNNEFEALAASIGMDNSESANGPVPVVIQSAIDGVRSANQETYYSTPANTTGASD